MAKDTHLSQNMVEKKQRVMLFLGGKPMICTPVDFDDEFFQIEMGPPDGEKMPYLVPKEAVSMVGIDGDRLVELADKEKAEADAEAKKPEIIVPKPGQVIT